MQGLGPTIFAREIQIDMVAYGSWIHAGKTGTDYYSSGNTLQWLGQTPRLMPIQLSQWGGAVAQVREACHFSRSGVQITATLVVVVRESVRTVQST